MGSGMAGSVIPTSQGEGTAILVVSSGWYGIGHLMRLSAIMRQVKMQWNVQTALFTLPSERERADIYELETAFDTLYWAVEPTQSEYREYVAQTYVENRQRLTQVVDAVRPRVLLFDLMMLIEFLDPVALRHTLVVGLLDERVWPDLRPGPNAPPAFAAIDEVIYVDALPPDIAPLGPRQQRVNHLSRFNTEPEGTATIDRTLVVVNAGGGSYSSVQRFIEQLLEEAVRRQDLTFVVVAGPLLPVDLLRRLEQRCELSANVHLKVSASPSEMSDLLRRARLCITAGGMSSTAECVAYRIPFVVASPCPPDDHVTLRGRIYEEYGICVLVELYSERATPAADVLRRALALRPDWSLVASNGAGEVAAHIGRWLAPDGAVHKANAVETMIVTLPGASRRDRFPLGLLRASTAIRVEVDPGVTGSSVVLESETDRLQRLIAVTRPSTILFSCAEASDVDLVDSLTVPTPFWVWTSGKPTFDERTTSGPLTPSQLEWLKDAPTEGEIWQVTARHATAALTEPGFTPAMNNERWRFSR